MNDAIPLTRAKPSYDWWQAQRGAKCQCGHTKEQHAHPGAGGTKCGQYPCPCSGFRKLS